VDPLADVFGLLDVRGAKCTRLEADAPWAIAFEGYRHVKLGAVLRGECVVRLDGVPGVHRLGPGDCYLLGNGRPHLLASAVDVRPVPSAEVFAGFVPGIPVRVGAGQDTTIVGCGFEFDAANASVLTDVLPPLVHIPADSPHAEPMRSVLRLLGPETAAPGLASSVVTERLAHVLLVQVLRAHIAGRGAQGGAWLTALADPQIGSALTVIHQDPAHDWTVADLAAKAGMSRSSFAARFTELVGRPPLEYIAGWRMRAAARDLRHTDRKIASIAFAAGYSSESAFSHAFKRTMGSSPGRYRVARRGDGGGGNDGGGVGGVGGSGDGDGAGGSEAGGPD
jgi:AraC-like DNA-binding protein